MRVRVGSGTVHSGIMFANVATHEAVQATKKRLTSGLASKEVAAGTGRSDTVARQASSEARERAHQGSCLVNPRPTP